MAGYVEDTIVAVATPPGVGAIAVVRLSGRDAQTIASRVLRCRGGGDAGAAALGESHRARLRMLRDPGSKRPIDEVLVLPMLAPRSFTGEDVVEIHCHGGRLVADLAFRALLTAGARAARPGEFTERAFLNGRLDLCQAEAVADLIEASSEAGLATAWQQLEGGLSRRVRALRDRILDTRALVEAHLDFPEEDLPPDVEAEITTDLAAIGTAVAELAATFDRGRLAREGLRVALVGRPNVGKSSLMNAILGRERALVSAEAGTTRDYIEEPAALGAVRVLLCDTAGLRVAGGEVERAGIERTRALVQSSDAVIVVLDASAPLEAEDALVLATCRARPRVVARNKVDLVSAWEPDEVGRFSEASSGARCVAVSARTGEGLTDLLEAVRQAVGLADRAGEVEVPLVTRARHHVALLETRAALQRAARALRESGLEMVSCELQSATAELDRLVGASDVEGVLDRVFSRFCVGK